MPIYTVTLNPVIDLVYSVPAFHKGTTFRANSFRIVPAGKGINVSFALASLGASSEAYVILGQDAVSLYDAACRARNVNLRAFSEPFTTRRHCTLLEQGGGVTHVRTYGEAVSLSSFYELADDLTRRLQAGDAIVISGSHPEGFPDFISSELIERCKRKQAEVYFDSNGAPLRIGLSARPMAAKINREEALEALEARREDFAADEELLQALMSRFGLEEAVITLGAEGVIGVLNGETYRVTIELPDIDVVDTVGCGDALMAGLVYGRIVLTKRGIDLLRYAAACATAAAKCIGPGSIVQRDVEALYRQAIKQE